MSRDVEKTVRDKRVQGAKGGKVVTGTQRSSLLLCLAGAESRRQAWLQRFRGSQAIGLRIRGFTSEGIGCEGLQTQ